MAKDLELELDSRPSGPNSTISDLFIAGVWECFILEDVVREIPGEPVSSWKIPKLTAIPSGRYELVLEDSPRFGPDTLTVRAVPGFSEVRVHAGNTAGDTDGCLLTGEQAAAGCIVAGTSRPALDALRARLVPWLKAGNRAWLTVNRADVPAT